MGGSGYVPKNPTTPGRTPGVIKRQVGIILKKLAAGPTGPLPVGKNKAVFGPPTGIGRLAQPIASALAGGTAVRAARRYTNQAAKTVGVPTKKVRKPAPKPPVAKKVIARKTV